MKISEQSALTRLRAKGFLGASLVGGAAGVVASLAVGEGHVMRAASGMLLVLLGGNVGGFAGMFARGALRWAFGGKETGEEYSAEAVLVLSAYGGFLGLVGALLGGDAGHAHFYAGAGAVVAGICAAALGNSIFVLLRLLVLDEMDEVSRAESMRRAVLEARLAVLSPDDGKLEP